VWTVGLVYYLEECSVVSFCSMTSFLPTFVVTVMMVTARDDQTMSIGLHSSESDGSHTNRSCGAPHSRPDECRPIDMV